MNSVTADYVSFGPFRLFSAARVLERDGVNIALGSRALDILIALVEHAGEIVPQRELMARAWRGLVVDSSNLRVQVATLRRTLDDGKQGARFIGNVPGQGYCFVAPISPNPAVQPGTLSDFGTHGKTTVSVSATHVMPRKFSNGVCCVDLGDLRDPSQVMSTVASAVGISPATRHLLPALRDFLRTTELLLVLDNCEHVLEAAAALAESLSNQQRRGHPDEARVAQRTRPVALSSDLDVR